MDGICIQHGAGRGKNKGLWAFCMYGFEGFVVSRISRYDPNAMNMIWCLQRLSQSYADVGRVAFPFTHDADESGISGKIFSSGSTKDLLVSRTYEFVSLRSSNNRRVVYYSSLLQMALEVSYSFAKTI